MGITTVFHFRVKGLVLHSGLFGLYRGNGKEDGSCSVGVRFNV